MTTTSRTTRVLVGKGSRKAQIREGVTHSAGNRCRSNRAEAFRYGSAVCCGEEEHTDTRTAERPHFSRRREVIDLRQHETDAVQSILFSAAKRPS